MFTHFHTVILISTKFGMLVQDHPGKVLDNWKHLLKFWKSPNLFYAYYSWTIHPSALSFCFIALACA
jgi:hypothetical protein